ncbi:MAG: iron-sulfur cluster assembly scaffold protein [Lysobacteraceae bacterium]
MKQTESSSASRTYHHALLEHARQPRFAALPDGGRTLCLHNRLCGDEVEAGMVVRDGRIAALGIQTNSCAITTAVSSLLAEALQGKTLVSAGALCRDALQQMEGSALSEPSASDIPELMRDILGGIRGFPARRRCATLPCEAVLGLLEKVAGAGGNLNGE